MKEIAIASPIGRRTSAQKKLLAIAALTAARRAWTLSAGRPGQRPPASNHTGSIIIAPKAERSSIAL